MQDFDQTMATARESLRWNMLYLNTRPAAAAEAWAIFEAAAAKIGGILEADREENSRNIRRLFRRDDELLREEYRGEIITEYNPAIDKVEVRRETGELLWEDPPSQHAWWSVRGTSDDQPEISYGDRETMHVIGCLRRQTRERTAAAIMQYHPEGDDSDAADLEQLAKAHVYWAKYDADRGYCIQAVG